MSAEDWVRSFDWPPLVDRYRPTAVINGHELTGLELPLNVKVVVT